MVLLNQLFQCGDRLYMPESDVCRRQILTYKDDPRTERIKIFIMVLNPSHRYLNEAETTDWDIYEDFKLKKTLESAWFEQK